jgi:hypothetical protein
VVRVTFNPDSIDFVVKLNYQKRELTDYFEEGIHLYLNSKMGVSSGFEEEFSCGRFLMQKRKPVSLKLFFLNNFFLFYRYCQAQFKIMN